MQHRVLAPHSTLNYMRRVHLEGSLRAGLQTYL